MSVAWSRKRVLITVRTYPIPAQTGVEVSCTAGITEDGQWIRLFPIPYRFLDEDKRLLAQRRLQELLNAGRVSISRQRVTRGPNKGKLNLDKC